jgi:hypothetical protein
MNIEMTGLPWLTGAAIVSFGLVSVTAAAETPSNSHPQEVEEFDWRPATQEDLDVLLSYSDPCTDYVDSRYATEQVPLLGEVDGVTCRSDLVSGEHQFEIRFRGLDAVVLVGASSLTKPELGPDVVPRIPISVTVAIVGLNASELNESLVRDNTDDLAAVVQRIAGHRGNP